jgi:hypothetical protein
MAYTQNTTVDAAKLIIGNCKIETATAGTTVGGTWVNMGNGVVTNAVHNITKYDVQGRNGPDPVEGISDETFTVDFELIEFTGTTLANIQCGAISESSTTVLSTIVGGGNSQLTPRAFKVTNTSIYSGNTVVTTFLIYNATMADGLNFQFKGDQEGDPVGIISGQIVGKNDETKTVGNQLFTLTRTIVP